MKGLPILIGICGASGSGKSYLSEKLSLELRQSYGHLSIEQFSLDRYYLGAEEKTSAERAKHNFDHPDEIDPRDRKMAGSNKRAGRPVASASRCARLVLLLPALFCECAFALVSYM